jgi:regulatory protein YycI of two-component signal transduction system YycFG
MPYNEFRDQALQYFEIGKQKLAEGNKGEARNNFNLAYNIADKNNLSDLKALIKSYLNSL